MLPLIWPAMYEVWSHLVSYCKTCLALVACIAGADIIVCEVRLSMLVYNIVSMPRRLCILTQILKTSSSCPFDMTPWNDWWPSLHCVCNIPEIRALVSLYLEPLLANRRRVLFICVKNMVIRFMGHGQQGSIGGIQVLSELPTKPVHPTESVNWYPSLGWL